MILLFGLLIFFGYIIGISYASKFDINTLMSFNKCISNETYCWINLPLGVTYDSEIISLGTCVSDISDNPLLKNITDFLIKNGIMRCYNLDIMGIGGYIILGIMLLFIIFGIFRWGKLTNFYNGIFQTNKNSDKEQVKIFDLFRFIGCFSVIYGHSIFSAINLIYFDNTSLIDVLRSPWMATISIGYLAVELFLFISGFLTSYLLDTKIDKMLETKSYLKILLIPIYRFIRVYPLLVLTILFYDNVLKYIIDKPLINSYNLHSDNISYSLLLINNFLPSDTTLNNTLWTWFISLDYQLFLGAFILICLMNTIELQTKFKYLIWLVIFVISLTYCTIQTAAVGIEPGFLLPSVYYFNTLSQAHIYIIGIIFGYLYKLNNENKFMSAISVIIGSIFICVIIGLHFAYHSFVSYELKSSLFDANGKIAYAILYRIFFSIGIGLIVLGMKNINTFNQLFDSAFIMMTSKLSYIMYLIHPILYILTYGSNLSMITITYIELIKNFIIVYVLSMIFGLILYLFFEKPIDDFLTSYKEKLMNINTEQKDDNSKQQIMDISTLVSIPKSIQNLRTIDEQTNLLNTININYTTSNDTTSNNTDYIRID
jgi:peptidoglycan/LPS O-acetylase OafA/YrhL